MPETLEERVQWLEEKVGQFLTVLEGLTEAIQDIQKILKNEPPK